MASPDSTFALTRATASDTLPTAALIYNSFDAFARENFFGIPTPTQIPLLAQEFATTMSADPADVWVKVTDDKTGEIVAASNWKIYLAPERALARVEDKPKAWVEDGEVRERMRALMGPMNERRARANLGAFMCAFCLPSTGIYQFLLHRSSLHDQTSISSPHTRPTAGSA